MRMHICAHTQTHTSSDKGQWGRGKGNSHQIWNEWVFRDLIKNTASVAYRNKVYLGNHLEANWLVLDTLRGCIRTERTCRVNVNLSWYVPILSRGNKWMGNIEWYKMLNVEGISGNHLSNGGRWEWMLMKWRVTEFTVEKGTVPPSGCNSGPSEKAIRESHDVGGGGNSRDNGSVLGALVWLRSFPKTSSVKKWVECRRRWHVGSEGWN